ncbi:Sodium/calcium exchanger membrane region [Dillenia turbinata]|uniref:Sodium/calcium exchanger membrane region n=1 Tax=Dillenia turbinata TaxID=194707 RepID=A0AAN8UMT9_9MAGN
MGSKTSKLRRIFNFLCALVVLFFFYNRVDILRNPLLRNSSSLMTGTGRELGKTSANHFDVIRRRTVEVIANSSKFVDRIDENNPDYCSSPVELMNYANKCEFLKAHPKCSFGGFIDYIKLFYCYCEKSSVLGYGVLAVWLAALFYMLGNTAADYFCCSLEMLANILKLPPTVAGVSLLPLGNGAPDVFASIAAFVGTDTGEVGLNSVLGGAVFVTCFLVGVVTLCVAERGVRIDQRCFIRDISFLLIALVSLSLILFAGRLTLGAAICFVSIYAVYAFVVASNEILMKHAKRLRLDSVLPILPVKGDLFSQAAHENAAIYSSLLRCESEGNPPQFHYSVPQWMWTSQVAIFSDQSIKIPSGDGESPLWSWKEGGEEPESSCYIYSRLFLLMDMPLTLLRQLTIPVVEEGWWSKGYAVASASFAPILLAILWGAHDGVDFHSGETAYLIGIIAGCVLGSLAFWYTRSDQPPRRFLFPWVFGGFFMSIVWFYIIANELVALLVGLGVIFEINPSILGLTVLAWGNSLGDLVSNIAFAMHGGDSIQIAFSGCYAGPMFNTLVGLGTSMLLRAWSVQPNSYVLPQDTSLFYTIGCLVTGLVWALVLLLCNNMQPSRTLGLGLITIYLIFLFVRLSSAVGVLSLASLS